MPLLENYKEFLSEGFSRVTIDEIINKEFTDKQISLSILRLDKIHPYISGNKIFKLKYFLDPESVKVKKVITFGGAYSNHLVATAYACKELKIESIGIIRGEEPTVLSHSLKMCLKAGMQLKFISRKDYDNKNENSFVQKLKYEYSDFVLIPEGGFDPLGMEGAAEIKSFFGDDFTHIVCAIGTATTIAGLISSSTGEQVIGINVTKDDATKRLNFLLKEDSLTNYLIFTQYNFGGYAKANRHLYDFMNDLFNKYNIPTDFVYTAKMMFGVFDLIRKDHFKPGSKILCIHTGGLQGNLSLPENVLNF